MPGGNSTPWSDQIETMTKAWVEAQKQMWEKWYDLARTAPAPPFYADLAEPWQKVAAQGVEAWTATTEPTAKDVSERLAASQKSFVDFFQFLTDTWKVVAAKAASGEEWQNTLKTYTEQWRQQLLQSPETMRHINQDLTELWQLYLKEWNKLAQPWLHSSQLARGHLGQAITGNGSELIDLTNLYWDAYERTFGRLVESPSLGYTRELNEKLLKGFDAWQDFRQASFEYQVILADTWVQAVERMVKELVALTEKGQPIKSLRELALLWNSVADPVFIEVFRSEKYIQIQGRLLNTAMHYRLHQREIAELFLKTSDIAARSEVDEAYRNIYEQRKELKALKKVVAELSPARPELEEARQSIEALRQEVKALKEALAAITAKEALQPAPAPPKAKPAPKAGKPAKSKAAAVAQASSQEGGEQP
ncbi:MAG: class III poly(R)-hydroxyalkanoic acid synthase subunit PhaE [Anaerolineales bacterium]|nr:class III poly(R)-hydroxyalkanoic acid synthase subunit PhaE [Anaerolineales bacterium]